MHAVFVSPATNDGAFVVHHVALVWTVGEHATQSASTRSTGSTQRSPSTSSWRATS
jgi:hypothetical protein